MTFSNPVSKVEVEKQYLYRNRFGKPTSESFKVLDKSEEAICFLTKSKEQHSLKASDWEEVVANLQSLRSGTMRRQDLKTWRPSYAYAFIGHFEQEGTSFFQTSIATQSPRNTE